jgi:hypothetical protein
MNHEDATHYLECRHAIGIRGFRYWMKCIPMKTMDDGRIKVMVFGSRYWKDGKDKKRVRYVAAERVIKIEDVK